MSRRCQNTPRVPIVDTESNLHQMSRNILCKHIFFVPRSVLFFIGGFIPVDWKQF